MRLTWSHTILPVLAIFITLSLACEESKPGAGGSVTPGTEDPRILEAYVYGNVRNGNDESGQTLANKNRRNQCQRIL